MIAITGAAGKLGRLVAAELAARIAPSQVVLGTRDPSKIAGLAAKGFKTARADFDDPASLAAAFAGAETVLIISGDTPNEVRLKQHIAAIDAAKAAKVQRVVYTSFVNPSEQSRFPFAWVHAKTEAYLRDSGLATTILRHNLYLENLAGALAKAKETGTIAQPGAAGKAAYISRADIAAVLAAVLTGTGHANKVYEITGPEAVDLAGVAAALAQALGRPVKAVEADPAATRNGLAAAGLPPFVVEALAGLYAATGAGEYARVSDDAARLAGRKLKTVAAFAREAAAG